MRYILLCALITINCDNEMITVIPVTNYQKTVNHNSTEWDIFVTSIATNYVSNPILLPDAPYENTSPAGIITDPLDSTKKLFYRGNYIGGSSITSFVSLFTGSSIDDPYDLGTEYGTVISGSESYDIQGCRFGCAVHVSGNTVWYYYTGVDASYNWRICRAVSTDGGRTFTKAGVALDFNGVDEGSLSGPSVYVENGTWYMCYTVWTGSPKIAPLFDPGTSTVGIKLATSSDGITWTETGTYLISPSTRHPRLEDAGFYKIGDKYALVLTSYNASFNWCLSLWSNDVPTTAFTFQKFILSDPALVHAVGFLVDYSDGFKYIYYQQESAPAVDPIYVAKFIPQNQ